MSFLEARKKLMDSSDKERAKNLQRFFQTGPGEYAEGDIFIGVKVPEIRRIAKQVKALDLKEIVRLLKSKIHEERLLALLLLVSKYARLDAIGKKKIYGLYLKHTKFINNWDLVDLTAGHIVGAFLKDKKRKPLYILAKSKILWERRISILSTSYFINTNEFDDTLKIAKLLIRDEEDLIHKAVGWMLREVGKRDFSCEETFLKKYYKAMPRTMLRYAIERFPEKKRQSYLKGTV